MALVDLLVVCFILCLFSLGFRLVDIAREEETFEYELIEARSEIKRLREEVDFLIEQLDRGNRNA